MEGSGISMGPDADAAMPTRVFPNRFLITFLVGADPMGGADHDTPAPVGKPGLDMDKKSASAGAGEGAVFVFAAVEMVVTSKVSVAGVAASPPHEGADVTGIVVEPGVASAGAGGAGGAEGVPVRNENPLVPLPTPTVESAAVVFASSTAAKLVSPLSLAVTWFLTSAFSSAALSPPPTPPSIPDMKLNEDPAVEEGAASIAADASVDGGARTADVAAGGERKENPLDTAETGGAATAASCAEERDADEDVFNPANMDGAATGGGATAVPFSAVDVVTPAAVVALSGAPPMEAERNPNADETALCADDGSPVGDLAASLAPVIPVADGAFGVVSEDALESPPLEG